MPNLREEIVESCFMLALDGPQFRSQRLALLTLLDMLKGFAKDGFDKDGLPDVVSDVEGLINLTDEIADQAHDIHALDCLLGNDYGEGEDSELNE